MTGRASIREGNDFSALRFEGEMRERGKEKSFAEEEPDVGGRTMNGCAWTDRVRRPHEPNREGDKRVNLDDFLPFSKICQST